MVIDERGLHISLEGREREYLWEDIQTVRTNTLAQKHNIHAIERVVQIRRKGQIIRDQYDDVIDGQFGIPVEELQNLIESGIRKWGSATQTT